MSTMFIYVAHVAFKVRVEYGIEKYVIYVFSPVAIETRATKNRSPYRTIILVTKC